MGAQRVAGRIESRARGLGAGPGTVRDNGVPPHGAVALLRDGPRLTAARVLSVVLLGLMLVQSLLGLLAPGLYPEAPWALAALRGNDLVTLAVVVPALAVAVYRSTTRTSSTSVAVWLGLLFYGVYNYAYYAFGAAFSDVFLLHVAAFSLSTYALVLLGTSLEVDAVAAGIRTGPAARIVAAFTTVLGAGLVVAWGTISARFAVTGRLPDDVMPPQAVHLVYALDLGVLAPAFLVSGILLWLRRPWGAVLASAANVSAAAYLLVLEVGGGYQANAGIGSATWASAPAIGGTVLCLLGAVTLLTGRSRAGVPPEPSPPR
jgi:hypothetical protein